MRRRMLIFVATMMVTVSALAQKLNVRGTVIDENKEAVIGASVLIKGSNIGTKTDIYGQFLLDGVKSGSELVISYVGMKTKTVQARSSLSIVLENDDQILDEVMVVAFGEQKKSSFTGSAGVVDSKKLEQRQVTNVMEALQGNVAGLQAYSHSGAPDAAPEFRIRGISSINAGKAPLIVLDGAPYDGDWNSINPSDVASVTVLKDAASNALYGARGANGVIIVTTKKGEKARTSITLDVKLGTSSRASKRYETIDDPAQYIETNYKALYNNYINQGQTIASAHANANKTLTASSQNGGLGYVPYAVPAGQYLVGDNGKLNPSATLGNRVYNDGQVYTIMPDDWIDEAYRNATRQEYNFSINGGGDNGTFFASLGYLNADGIAVGSDYERYTSRLKATYQATKWLNVGGNVSFARSTTNNGADVSDTEDSGANNIYSQIIMMGPIYPVYLRDGEGNILRNENGIVGDFGDGQVMGSDMVRPYLTQVNGIAEASMNTNKWVITNFSLNGFADFDIWDGLKATVNANIYSYQEKNTSTQQPFYGFGHMSYPSGYVYKYNSSIFTQNYQQLLKYNKRFGKHNVSLLAGHESYKSNTDYLYADRKNMFSYWGNQELNGATTYLSNGGYKVDYNTEGWIFRGLYDFDGKYFGQVSYRRDASSRFHPDHRWGNFYSFGGAWIITKEEWMKDVKWLNELKLKASFGQNGNDNIGDFLYTDLYNINKGDGNDITLTLSSIGNENITWETITNINLGVEFQMFNNRLRGSVEYFYRKTTDMLSWVTVPLELGYSGSYYNVGDMSNKGIEMELSGEPIVTKNFRWTVGANLTAYKNEVLKLNDSNKFNTLDGHPGYTSGSYFYGEGLPMYTWRLRKYAGVNENGESMWYKHADDGSLTTTTDPTSITLDKDFFDCGTALPDFYGGFNTGISAYGIDLNVSFAYSVGGKVMDWTYMQLMQNPQSGLTGMAMHQDLLNAWSADNTTSNVPRLCYNDQYANYTSDRFLTDGSWLALQNITLGYNLPKKWMNSLGINGIHIAVSGENLTYWSKRKGLDPRLNASGSISATKYAPARTITGSISVKF
ncbi:MAG: TonB-dependent receptor [Prevotella sp.]|nr:TonB-dependent receptor [Prevotella sp.]